MDGTEQIEVSFRCPAEVGAKSVVVSGDFNDWSLTALPMQHTSSGLSVSIELAVGRWYRYRYWVDDERWENDWYADSYRPNPFGGDDAVVDLTADSPRVRAHRAASRPTE